MTGGDIAYDAEKARRAWEEMGARRGLTYSPSTAGDYSGAIEDYIRKGGKDSASYIKQLEQGSAYQDPERNYAQPIYERIFGPGADVSQWTGSGLLTPEEIRRISGGIATYSVLQDAERRLLGSGVGAPKGTVTDDQRAQMAREAQFAEAMRADPRLREIMQNPVGAAPTGRSVARPTYDSGQSASTFQDQMGEIMRSRDRALQSLDLGLEAGAASSQYRSAMAGIQQSMQVSPWRQFVMQQVQSLPYNINEAGAYGFANMGGSQQYQIDESKRVPF